MIKSCAQAFAYAFAFATVFATPSFAQAESFDDPVIAVAKNLIAEKQYSRALGHIVGSLKDLRQVDGQVQYDEWKVLSRFFRTALLANDDLHQEFHTYFKIKSEIEYSAAHYQNDLNLRNEALNRVVKEFPMTTSAQDALIQLGTSSLEIDPMKAAFYFEELRFAIGYPDAISTLDLYRQAVAFSRVNDSEGVSTVLQHLSKREPANQRLSAGGAGHFGLEDMRAVLTRKLRDIHLAPNLEVDVYNRHDIWVLSDGLLLFAAHSELTWIKGNQIKARFSFPNEEQITTYLPLRDGSVLAKGDGTHLVQVREGDVVYRYNELNQPHLFFSECEDGSFAVGPVGDNQIVRIKKGAQVSEFQLGTEGLRSFACVGDGSIVWEDSQGSLKWTNKSGYSHSLHDSRFPQYTYTNFLGTVDGTVVLIKNKSLIGIKDGQILWVKNFDDHLHHRTALNQRTGTVVVTEGRSIHWVDVSTGQSRYRTQFNRGYQISALNLGPADRIVIQTLSDETVIFRDGEVIDQFQIAADYLHTVIPARNGLYISIYLPPDSEGLKYQIAWFDRETPLYFDKQLNQPLKKMDRFYILAAKDWLTPMGAQRLQPAVSW